MISTDLGWYVGIFMADIVPESIIGHFSDFWVIPPNSTDLERYARNETTERETSYIRSYQEEFNNHYSQGPVHSLTPLAIGQAMSDTPVGFAGWAWQLIHHLSDGYDYTFDELITDAMMLWIQGTYGNIRAYKELFQVSLHTGILGRVLEIDMLNTLIQDGKNIPVTKVPTAASNWGYRNGPFPNIDGLRLIVRLLFPCPFFL